jgi:hypothetical protein
MIGTPRPADHEEYDALAVGWALHALEPEDETAFARHLPECPRCARTVADTEEVMSSLAAGLPPAEPSEDLRHRLRAAVERTEQVHPAPPVPTAMPQDVVPRGEPRPDGNGPAAGTPVTGDPATPSRFSSLRERGWVLAAAAATAGVVGLGIWNVSLSTARERAEQVAAEQGTLVEELLRPGAEVVAQLVGAEEAPVATVVERDGNVEVVAQALPVNDELTETYVLWGLRDGSTAPEAVGAFDVVRSRPDLEHVGSVEAGSGGYDAYAVSIEPGRQPPAAPSEVLARGQVTS